MGFLPYDKWYSREQLILAERAVADLDGMEIGLYALIKFLADAKLAPKAVAEVSVLLEKVQEIRSKLKSDVSDSTRREQEALKRK